MTQTVFERNGGFAKISRVVVSFYDRVLESPIMSPYFQNTDMKTLIDHQTKFIAFLMGGPASFPDDHLERIHQNLGIDRKAFVEMVELLTETLEDFDFSDDDIDAVAKQIEMRTHLIVTKP